VSFTEGDLHAAFPGSKVCDGGIDYGGDVVLAEVGSGTARVPTRQEADVASFCADADRLVVDKLKQLHATAGNLLCDPQLPNSPLTGPPDRIFPVVIFGGQFPVNPLTLHYLGERLGAAGMRPEGASSR
jgi:hypothetical protein